MEKDEDVKIVISQKGTIPVYTTTRIAGVEIFHDESLEGKGTPSIPLKISEEIIEKIENAGKVDDVEVNGVSVVENKIANVIVPTKVSELDNDEGYITGVDWDDVTNKPQFANVATSGDYNDLINTPTNVSDFNNDANYQNATQVENAISAATQNMVETGDNITVLTNNANYQTQTQVENAVSVKVDKVSSANKVYGTDANGAQTTYDVDSFGQVDDVKVNNVSVVTNKVANITQPDVIDNLTSTSTTDSLSANQGRVLQSEIESLQGLGRYLTVWNCTTGLAETNPPQSPYAYHSGDYFLVGVVGATNYRPSGSSYVIGQASQTVETEDVKVNDVYIYDGTNWKLQQNAQREVVFSSIGGDPYDNQNLATALNAKQATLVSGTNIKTLNNNSLLGTGNISTLTTISYNAETEELTIS